MGLGFEFSGLGFELLGLGFEVSGLGFEVSGLGFEGLWGRPPIPTGLRGFGSVAHPPTPPRKYSPTGSVRERANLKVLVDSGRGFWRAIVFRFFALLGVRC